VKESEATRSLGFCNLAILILFLVAAMDIKSSGTPQCSPQIQQQRENRQYKLLICCVAFLLWLAVSLSRSSNPFLHLWKERLLAADGTSERASSFRWSQITPSQDLEYHDCYDGFKCARLAVPMDYNAPARADNQVALAMVRKPAKVPVSDPHYGGAILINPGGPGGSGVAQVLDYGSQIQQVLDAERAPSEAEEFDKYFDIIGFDPRGINRSTPTISCFQDNFARQVWNLQSEAEGLLGSSDGSLRLGWRRARALAAGCTTRNDNDNSTSSILEHVNTTPVAADMVEIIERHGQWRENQGRMAQDAFTKVHKRHANQGIISRTKWNRGMEKLQYWGFSYGTLLGATFASMYPERVSRVVLDGVVSTDDYYNGPWLGNLQDTDRIFERIFEYCDQAGPEGCQFWRAGGAKAIQAVYEKLLHDIWDDPLSVVGNGRRGPGHNMRPGPDKVQSIL